MTATTIRQAVIGDLEELSVLFNDYRQFYEQPNDLVAASQFIKKRLNHRDSIIFVVADKEHKLIGFCQLYPTFCSVIAEPICVLYDLFVDKSARNTGAGKLLMLAAHEYGKINGFARIDLTTAKTNLVAQSLYESLGWVRDEVFYTYSRLI